MIKLLKSITSATASTNNICPNTTVTLTANGVTPGSGATLTWFDGANGTGNNLGSGGTKSVSPASTTTYYARLAGTATSTQTVTVDKTASAITSTTANTNNVCPNTAVTLTANGVTSGSGATLTWFDGAGGTGNNLGTGATKSVSPATTTTYYARLEGTCNTVEASITVTVQAAIDFTVTNASPVLTANQAGAAYRWLDCDNGNAVIPSETNQSFTATENGNYAVEITVGLCVDTSVCENVSTVGIGEVTTKIASIYPNPTSGIFTIELTELSENSSLTVYDMLGKIIVRKESITTTTQIDLSGNEKGIYLINIQTNNKQTVRKITIQ